MLNIISLILGICAWVGAIFAIVKSANFQKSTMLSLVCCVISLLAQLIEISRRVNLGDYAAIEDTIRAIVMASVILVVVTVALNLVAIIRSKKRS